MSRLRARSSLRVGQQPGADGGADKTRALRARPTDDTETSAAEPREGQTTSDLRRRIGRSVGQLLAGEAVNKMLRFGATVVLARALTASDFGLVNVGIAISGITLAVCSLGLPDQGSREVAIDPLRAGWLVGRVLAARVACVALVAVAGIPLAEAVWPGHTLLLVFAAAMAAVMASSGDWLARGLERMSVAAAANATGGLVLLLGSLVVAVLGANATAALASFAVAEAAVALILWWRVHRGFTVQFGLREIRPMLLRARPLALSSVAIYSYYANIDTLILATTHSNREAGLYSAPYRLFLVLNLVGVFAACAMLPTLAQLAVEKKDAAASDLLVSTFGLLAAYGLLALGVVELFGAQLLAGLFGPQFRVASGTFVLLTAGAAWYSIGYPAGYSLIALGQNRRFLRGAATASVLSFGLDLALIPPLGMRGAGLATLVAFTAAALVWLVARQALSRDSATMLAALTIATALAILVGLAQIRATSAGLLTLALAGLVIARSLRIRRRVRQLHRGAH